MLNKNCFDFDLTDERTGGGHTTFLRKNLHDQITASGSIPRNNLEYKADVDSLYLQLTQLLNEKVGHHSL